MKLKDDNEKRAVIERVQKEWWDYFSLCLDENTPRLSTESVGRCNKSESAGTLAETSPIVRYRSDANKESKIVTRSEIEALLNFERDVAAGIDWNELEAGAAYPVPRPRKEPLPPEPKSPGERVGLNREKASGEALENMRQRVGRLLPCVLNVPRRAATEAAYHAAVDAWRSTVEEMEDVGSRELQIYADQVAYWSVWTHRIGKQNERAIARWNDGRQQWEADQAQRRRLIRLIKGRYAQGDAWAIRQYCKLVLSRNIYPRCFPKVMKIAYDRANHTVIAEPELPNLLEVAVVQSLSGRSPVVGDERMKLHEQAQYAVALRILRDLSSADVAGAIKRVTVNGWLSSTSTKTGRKRRVCALSVGAKKDRILSLDLKKIEGRDAFKSLGGVCCKDWSSPNGVVPEAIIKDCSWAKDAQQRLSQGIVRLETLQPKELEELVAELLRRELKSKDVQVKVVGKRGDGGVDIVVTGRDAISGGKTLVQVKRRRRAVEVEAVRELYGAVINAGANKGILVTTSYFGEASRRFVRNKPISLLSGQDLIALLKKYGLDSWMG